MAFNMTHRLLTQFAQMALFLVVLLYGASSARAAQTVWLTDLDLTNLHYEG